MSKSFHFSISGEGSGVVEPQADGSLLVRGRRIFRTGSFRDSRGRKRDWSLGQLAAAAENFRRLAMVLPNIPVRRDHSRDVADVMGYITDVRVEGNYLVADYSVSNPDDVAKVQNGTYRSVSIEIGEYTTNDEEKHNPVVLGLAYVDLPAVEGLYTLHKEEPEMPFSQEELDWAVAASYAAALDASAGQVDFALAAGYAQADIDVRAEFARNDDDKPPFKFALSDGTETTDYAAVQADIVSLNTELTAAKGALEEGAKVARHAFVTKLAEDGKIAAPQVAGFQAHVDTLTPEGFAAFTAIYENAPKLGVLDGGGAGGPSGAPDPANAVAGEIELLEQQVGFHRFAGLSEDQVRELDSYKRLEQLKSQTNSQEG